MLLRDDEKLAPLLDNINLHDIDIKLYKRHMEGQYYSWILCCGFLNADSLLSNWTSIVNGAALYIQAELENAIERYNLYIVFFVNNEVTGELKMQIEQDKYSSRKLIISEPLPSSTNEINERIDKLLFNVKPVDKHLDEEILLEEWLAEVDPTFYALYLQYNDRPQFISDFLKEYAASLQVEDGDE